MWRAFGQALRAIEKDNQCDQEREGERERRGGGGGNEGGGEGKGEREGERGEMFKIECVTNSSPQKITVITLAS